MAAPMVLISVGNRHPRERGSRACSWLEQGGTAKARRLWIPAFAQGCPENRAGLWRCRPARPINIQAGQQPLCALQRGEGPVAREPLAHGLDPWGRDGEVGDAANRIGGRLTLPSPPGRRGERVKRAPLEQNLAATLFKDCPSTLPGLPCAFAEMTNNLLNFDVHFWVSL
jgi:hypothetical protein